LLPLANQKTRGCTDPINSRSAFTALINSAQHTLLIEAEEMNDSSIEQALINAGKLQSTFQTDWGVSRNV